MHLVGYIDNLPIQVFVDSSVDLNFLNPSVAMHLSLHIDRSLVDLIAIANDGLYYTIGLTYNFTVTFQGYTFSSDICIFSVMGCYLVIRDK